MIEGPRAARQEELPAVVALSNMVFYPDGRIDRGRFFPTLFSTVNARNLAHAILDASDAEYLDIEITALHGFPPRIGPHSRLK